MINEKGQTLLEVLTATAVGVLVVTALTVATVFSLRNATFAKNSAQATKLAQEGIEKVRGIRDRETTIYTNINYPSSSPARNINKFSELFAVDISHTSCGDISCYFRFASGILSQGTNADFETVNSFKRQVLIGDQTSSTCSVSDFDKYCNQKTVTVIVQWTDFAGPHESRLTTILRKL